MICTALPWQMFATTAKTAFYTHRHHKPCSICTQCWRSSINAHLPVFDYWKQTLGVGKIACLTGLTTTVSLAYLKDTILYWLGLEGKINLFIFKLSYFLQKYSNFQMNSLWNSLSIVYLIQLWNSLFTWWGPNYKNNLTYVRDINIKYRFTLQIYRWL